MAKKLKIIATLISFTIMFFILAPVIPLPIEIQKQAMSVLYSDESSAENVAKIIFHILQHPGKYGFKSQEEVAGWLKKNSWVTGDGATRQIYIEPELLGDISGPTIINSVKITLIRKRDSSRTTHRYHVYPGFYKF